MKMPFGKHAGVELPDVPKPYLRWLRTQQWIGGWLIKEIDAVLNGEVVTSSDESFEEALKTWKESDNE
jgi:uncharacterized protein (DUF3820 family)